MQRGIFPRTTLNILPSGVFQKSDTCKEKYINLIAIYILLCIHALTKCDTHLQKS